MDTIKAVSQTLESYLKHELDDEAEVVAALEELDGVDIDVNLLSTTRIGKTISRLVKDKRSADVLANAKKLEKKWKTAIMKAPKTENKRKREETSSESPAQKRKIKHEVKEETKVVPQVKKEQQVVKKEKEEEEETKEGEAKPSHVPTPVKEFKGESSNSARNQVQIKLWQALGPCQLQGGTESSQVAVAIENSLFKVYSDPKHKEYLLKFRSLFSNLKDELNSGLRNALFTGDLTSDRLIQMSYEELANPKLQKERKDLKEIQQEARRGDRHIREATCSMFTCHKCGDNKTTYFQLQTRSADEPMTTFVTCCNCGNHWKFS